MQIIPDMLNIKFIFKKIVKHFSEGELFPLTGRNGRFDGAAFLYTSIMAGNTISVRI